LDDIKAGARALFNPKQLVEVRVMGPNKLIRGFYFDDHERMAEAVLQLDKDPRVQSVYYILNEIDPKAVEKHGPLVRNPSPEQVEQILSGPSRELTKNEDIRWLRWMFIDVDTVRPAPYDHDSSTKAEKAACKEVFNAVLAYLDSRGWPALIADSGNGYHILVRMDLPSIPSNTMCVEDCLKALSAKFSCAAAKIDTAVYNPGRITRAYGSTTRKGESTPERPHRQNKIKAPEKKLTAVTMDQIIALADEGPKAGKASRKNMPLLHESFEPDDFFEWYENQEAFEITATKDWQGHTVAVVDRCIISGTKHTGSALTGFIIGDSFGYHCWSPECDSPNIGDVLRKLHEDGYERYKKPIWTEEPLLLNFEENQREFMAVLEQDGQPYLPPTSAAEPPAKPAFEAEEDESESITDGLQERIEADAAVEAAEDRVGPPAKPIHEKPVRIGDITPNQYAEWLMSVVFRDPEAALVDYGFFRKRLEGISKNLADAVRETFGAMVFFERVNRYLPSKAQLMDFINNSDECRKIPIKKEACDLISAMKDDGTHFFDTTAKRLIAEMDWKVEREIVRVAFNKHLIDKDAVDVEAFRTALRKHWASTVGFNSDFKPGTWQENTDMIYEAFRKDVSGEGDGRKFKLGFDSIDCKASIGLDGNHALVFYGPASNRKTNAVMTVGLNFAMQGKRGLFLAGEHLRSKIEKRLTLMLSYYLRRDAKNPDGLVPVIPGLPKWEGTKRTATYEDLENIGIVLRELKAMQVVPGYIEVQNINSIIRGEEDPLGAIISYIDSTHKKYDWDFVIIDPLDTILPTDADKNQFNASAAVVDRLFDYSRGFAGDRGLMVIVTAQFKADVRRDIEKVQAKNGGVEDFDDEIVAILRRDSNIQYIGNKLTQRFDLAIGVALRVKDGNQGMLVQGRSREGGSFDVMPFDIDPDSNLMLESAGSVVRNTAAEAPSAHEDHEPYDDL
jgi:hypothetical protein